MANYFNSCKTQEDIKRVYRDLAKKLHPDHGGSKEEMIELTRQYDEMIKYGPTVNRFERTSTMNHEEVLREGFKKAQEDYQRSYGGYGGYRYANQGSMWNEYKQQYNDPRIADYERMRKEHINMSREYCEMLNQKYSFELEIEKLKKKIDRLEKKLKKPLKQKKEAKSSASICL